MDGEDKNRNFSYTLYIGIDDRSKSLKYRHINLIDGHISYKPDSFIPYDNRDLSESENENIDTICRDHNSIELESTCLGLNKIELNIKISNQNPHL